MQPPAPPKPRWYNRLAAAAAGALGGYMATRYPGRVNPATVQQAEQNLMMPGYAQQRATFEQRRADLEAKQKEAETQENTDSLAEQRMGTAARNREQAANYAETQRTKRQQIQAQQDTATAKLQQEKDARALKAFTTYTGKLPVVYRSAGQPAPSGWEQVPIDNPEAPPGMKAYIPPPTASVPKELVPYMPGRKEGDIVSRQELDAPAATYRAELEKRNLQDNKPSRMDAAALAVKAAGGDPNDPDSVTPDVARRASGILKPPPASIQVGNMASDDTIDFQAKKYLQTGSLPAGAGRNPMLASRILNRATALAKQQGMDPEEMGVSTEAFKANAKALADQTTKRSQIGNMEKTAGKNLDVFLNQAQKVIDTGSPIVNKVFRGGARDITGDPATAAFDAARVTAFTEISRVLSGSQNGVLSDSARREAESILKGDYTLKQLVDVAKVLRTDMKNRAQSFDDQIAEIRKAMGSRAPGATTGGGRGASSASDPLGILPGRN